MKFKKRKFIKILGFTLIMLFPIKALLATTKKIINPIYLKNKNIMFNEGTERPSCDLLKEKEKVFITVLIAGTTLCFNSKYDSGTGWPSFYFTGAFKTKIDYSLEWKSEYHCAKCGAHHGHVFNDGPRESGKRFCNNGLCLIFKPEY